MLTVIKRDGRKVPFDSKKIIRAIEYASKASGETVPLNAREKIAQFVSAVPKSEISIDQIQNLVEELLMHSDYRKTAKKYIIYRDRRDKDRDKHNKQIKTFNEIIDVAENNLTRENANINAATPAGMMMKFASETTKDYALDYLINPEHADAHRDGSIHIHDLDYYTTGSTTCLTGDTFITLKDENGKIINTQMKFFDRFFSQNNNGKSELSTIGTYQILGRNGWTLIENASRRMLKKEEQLLHIKTKKGVGLKVTAEHRIPVIRNGEELLLSARDIQKKDCLISDVIGAEYDENEYIDVASNLSDIVGFENDVYVCNIDKLKKWFYYKYDITNFSSFVQSKTYRHGTSYIYPKELADLRKKYEIPYEVLLSLNIKTKGSKFRIPLMLPVTPELAKLFGYIYGDGHVSFSKASGSYHLTFINKDQRLLDDFSRCCKKVFARTPSMYSNQTDSVTIADKTISFLVSQVLGKKAGVFDISIPNFMFNASDEIKFSFLSSLIDTDGHITNTKNLQVIGYSSVCENFAKQIMKILFSVGIESSISRTKTEGSIAYFKDTTSIRNGDSFSVLVYGVENIKKYITNLTRFKDAMKLQDYAFTTKSIKRKGEVIVDIFKTNEQVYVYDLETVEHWYIANNYVVHNCSMIDLIEILRDGFETSDGSVREPKSVRTAAQLAAIIMQSNQNEQHGGRLILASLAQRCA